MTRWRSWGIALIILCLAVYVPGLKGLPPVDRDECRFAQASRQMLEAATLPPDQLDKRVDAQGHPIGRHAGGWAVPMYDGKPRLNKPPLVYWLQSASVYILTGGNTADDAIWMYRVPSVLSAILSVLLTWRLGIKMGSPFAGFLAAAMLAVCPMFVWDAHQARSDQLLTATVVASMYFLWHIWSTRRTPPSLPRQLLNAGGFWICFGLSMLAKGPVSTTLIAVMWLAFCFVPYFLTPRASRRDQPSPIAWLKLTHPILGLVILAAMLVPWLMAIDSAFGLARFTKLVTDEFFVRATAGASEGHFAPPGTHTVLMALLFWPGCALALGGVFAGWRSWRTAHRGGLAAQRASTRDPSTNFVSGIHPPSHGTNADANLFLLTWVVPMWILFELSLAKLPHYTMPLYPALALLSARFLMHLAEVDRCLKQQMLLPAGARRRNLGDRVWIGIGASSAGLLCFVLTPMMSSVAQPFHSREPGSFEVTTGLGSLITGFIVLVVAMYCLGSADNAFKRRSRDGTMWRAIFASVLITATAFALVLPVFVPGQLSARIFEVINNWNPNHSRPIASVYHEDSIIFNSRGRAERIHTTAMLTWLREHPTGIAIIDERQLSEAKRLGFNSMGSFVGENSTMPKGERSTFLHVVAADFKPQANTPRSSPNP